MIMPILNKLSKLVKQEFWGVISSAKVPEVSGMYTNFVPRDLLQLYSWTKSTPYFYALVLRAGTAKNLVDGLRWKQKLNWHSRVETPLLSSWNLIFCHFFHFHIFSYLVNHNRFKKKILLRTLRLIDWISLGANAVKTRRGRPRW